MKRFAIGMLMVFALSLAATVAVQACPNCKDQIAMQFTPDGKRLVDPYESQRGFAHSIYLMLACVYGCPSVVILLLWRSMRAAEARRRRARRVLVPTEMTQGAQL